MALLPLATLTTRPFSSASKIVKFITGSDVAQSSSVLNPPVTVISAVISKTGAVLAVYVPAAICISSPSSAKSKACCKVHGLAIVQFDVGSPLAVTYRVGPSGAAGAADEESTHNAPNSSPNANKTANGMMASVPIFFNEVICIWDWE